MTKLLSYIPFFFLIFGPMAWGSSWNCPVSIDEMKTQAKSEASALYQDLEAIVTTSDANLPSMSEFIQILESMDLECKGECFFKRKYKTEYFAEHSCQYYVQCRVYVEYDCSARQPKVRLEIDPE